jgi:hypothetical protein
MRRLHAFSIASVSFAVFLGACGGQSTQQSKEGAGGAGSGSTGSVEAISTGAGNAPSTHYPAPHPAAPSVAWLHGPVLKSPKIVPIFFAGDDTTFTSQVETFVDGIGATQYWAAIGTEYEVGPATGLPAIQLSEAANPSLLDSDVQAWLKAKVEAGDPFPANDGNTLYAIYYPEGVSISLVSQGQTSKSCHDFGGYHSSVKLSDGTSAPYAVIPRCKFFDAFSGLDAVTAASSHEFIEASTDPFPETDPAYAQPDQDHFYWEFALFGGEVGDMCAAQIQSFTQFSEFPFVVQRAWSNKSAAEGHDPCVPALPGEVYFNSAAVLPDLVNLPGLGQVHAIKIPTGQTKTIEVELFSDADTGEPWTVSAQDLATQNFQAPELELNFEQNQGQNGQKLKLDITVLQASPYNAEVFTITSELHGTKNLWVGLVSQ